MKKWIKNLILIIAIFCSISLNGQGSMTINHNQYNQWILSNQPCVGCGSFYIMIVNNPIPNEKGYYFYDIYCWTYSSYANGFVASTYLKNINFYFVGASGDEIFIMNMPYAVVPPKSKYFNGYFYLAYAYSTSATQTIKLTWSDVKSW